MKLFSSLVKRVTSLKPRRPAARPKPARRRLTLQALEERCVPSTISEYAPLPTAYARPMGITSAYDGSVWFTQSYANKVTRLDPATGVRTDFNVPTASSSPQQIVASPNGYVWFTEYSGKKIGRIHQSGGPIAEFAMRGYGERPTALTVHPTTGVVWFASVESPSVARIGNISAAGVITKLATANTAAVVSSMTFGPDGNLWVTRVSSQWGDSISKVITSGYGSWTHYRLAAYSNPQGITVGADGKLWFTEYASNKIGKITTTGVVTEYAVPAGSGPRSIVAGADGALWFTSQTGNKIGRMTTDGVYSEMAVPAASGQPYGLAVGRGAYAGSVFFTEYGTGGNKVGRVDL